MFRFRPAKTVYNLNLNPLRQHYRLALQKAHKAQQAAHDRVLQHQQAVARLQAQKVRDPRLEQLAQTRLTLALHQLHAAIQQQDAVRKRYRAERKKAVRQHYATLHNAVALGLDHPEAKEAVRDRIRAIQQTHGRVIPGLYRHPTSPQPMARGQRVILRLIGLIPGARRFVYNIRARNLIGPPARAPRKNNNPDATPAQP